MKADGGAAFPHSLDQIFHRSNESDARFGTWGPAMGKGMSLRDYFAAAALQAMHGNAADIFTASLVPPERTAPGEERDYLVKRLASLSGAAYAIADAMLAERAK